MKYLFLLITLAIFGSLNSQTLKVGDKLSFSSVEIINYPEKRLNIKKLNGKQLILDFWTFNCLSCIQSFEKLDSLRVLYPKQVEFFLVSRNSKEEVLQFFKKFEKNFKMPNIPMIVNASELFDLLAVKKVPDVIWLDGNGVIRHRTTQINGKAVADFIAGRKPLIKEKIVGSDFKSYVSLLDQPNQSYRDRIITYSYIARIVGKENIGSGNPQFLNNKKQVRLAMSGTIGQLFEIAYGENDHRFFLRSTMNIKYLIRDSLMFMQPSEPTDSISFIAYSNWMKQNRYSYECVLPIEDSALIYEQMRYDLCRFFKVKARIDKIRIPGIALIRNNDSLKIYSPLQFSNINLGERTHLLVGDTIYMNNVPISRLDNLIRTTIGFYYNLPYQNLTGYTGKINFRYPYSRKTDIEYFKNILKPFGLSLVESEVITDCLVIEDQKKEEY